MRTPHAQRVCPSCRVRHTVPPPEVSPNFTLLNIDRAQWHQLRNAAEAFDRAASALEAEEGSSGAGDGKTLFPSRAFVDWIKPDCEGFREDRYDVDGVRSGRVSEPFPLPMGSDGRRRTPRRGAA